MAAGPDEPLLFLYPHWAATALRQRRPIISSLPRSATGHASPPSFCPQSTRWVSSNAAVESQSVSTEQPSIGEEDDSQNYEEKWDNTVPIESGKDDSQRYEEKWDSVSPVGSQKNDSQHCEEKGEDSSPVESQSATTQTHDSLSPQARRLKAVNVSRKHTRPLAAARKDAAFKKMPGRDQRKLLYRQFLRSWNPKMQTSRLGDRDWNDSRILLEAMQQHANRISEMQQCFGWIRMDYKYTDMYVPEETIALFSGIINTAMEENFWYAPIRNGCRVHVLPKEGDGVCRKVVLSGSEHVRELVKDRILRAQNAQASGDPLVHVYKAPVPVFTSVDAMRRKNLPVPVIRGVWDFSAKRARSLDEVLAAPPTINSVKELAEHVEDLTSPQTAGRGSIFRRTIARHIVALFRHDANRAYLSTAALNRALIFLCDHEFLDDVRVVFLRAEHLATTDTYNILLRSAARRQDVWTFYHFLLSMKRTYIRPIPPNPGTWLALLEALVTPRDKADLMIQMVQLGCMEDISTIRSALQLTIQDALLMHLEAGKSIDSFFDLIDETVGANWLTPSLLSQMFSVTARLKDFDAMDRLRQVCIDRHFPIDSSSLDQIVRMCRRNIFLALHYIFRSVDRREMRLSHRTYERLFLVAFKGRHYNICRVLWRYACMDEAVTFKMKDAVYTSLIRNASKKDTDDTYSLWGLNAGKVIVGLDLHLDKYSMQESLLEDLPSEFRHNPVLYLSTGFKPKGKERDRQRRLAAALVDRDVKLGANHYKPLHTLPVMLDAAAIMDRDWQGKPWPLTWVMQNAIRVPLKFRKPEERPL